MKKIGILHGKESTFPPAFVERVNQKAPEGIVAEPLLVEEVIQGKAIDYAVVIDRISQDVPFYRAYLKNAALMGTAVINNPFWWSADEKFFNNALATTIGVPVPNTVLLPSKARPDDTDHNSFRNMKFPMDWDAIFNYIKGFPAYMKPYAGGGWKSVYKLHNVDEFYAAYEETGQLVMMLQEEVKFDEYYRCYYVGGQMRIMPYEPRNPHHLRYVQDAEPLSAARKAELEDLITKICVNLGYDFNTVEFAVRDGIPYAIDFCNPAPDAELTSVGEENFEWVVEASANFAIERAKAHRDGKDNLTWGHYMRNAIMSHEVTAQANGNGNGTNGKAKAAPKAKPAAKKAPAKKAAPKKAPVKAEALSGAARTKAQATLLKSIGSATAKDKDDLKVIKGVGPKLEGILNDMGIFTYKQVSKMKKKEYDLVDSMLSTFKGRGQRDDWAGQAKKLA